MHPDQHASTARAIDHELTLNDVRHEFGDRWDIAPITGGFRAVIRETGGHTPIPRYGRTPTELAESIRHAEHQP